MAPRPTLEDPRCLQRGTAEVGRPARISIVKKNARKTTHENWPVKYNLVGDDTTGLSTTDGQIKIQRLEQGHTVMDH